MRVEATPHNAASELALEVYRRTLDAVRADRLVQNNLRREGKTLFVQGRAYDLTAYRRIRLAGMGKASVAMVSAALELLADDVTDGLVVTKDEPVAPEPIRTLYGSHPVPDARSVDAGAALWKFAQESTDQDLVLFFLSGGASALAEHLEEGVSLDDLRRATEKLLASGQPIEVINGIRARVSRIKGGGLGGAFRGATVVVVVLSDVVSGRLEAVGSGPFTEPRNLNLSDELIDAMPEAIRTEIRSSGLIRRPRLAVPHCVVGSVSVAVHAAADAARELGLEVFAFQDPLQGEAREMARQVLTLTEKVNRNRPEGGYCVVLGGECTVRLRGKGKGGRAQEMALAAAPRLDQLGGDYAFLAAGTDGSDGPTDAAGGIVDPGSLARAREQGQEARNALASNDSYAFLSACGGLIRTGPTGSNVNDICLVVRSS